MTAEMQPRRYDNKARRLFKAASDTAIVEGVVVHVPKSVWDALATGLDRELMPGDLELYAEQYPARVLKAAQKILADGAWMARALRGEGA